MACGGERSRSACCCSREQSRERGGRQGTEEMEAEAVHDLVEIKASRRLHTVSSTMHEHHEASAVCRGGQRRARASGRGRRPCGHGPRHSAAAGARAGEKTEPLWPAGRKGSGDLLR
jgi:hypothetical protein